MEIQSRFLLDRELFEDLKSYLEDKRVALRDALLMSIARPSVSPQLEPPLEKAATLLDALVVFNTQWQNLPPQTLKYFDEQGMIERLSNILWNYVEILEGMCRELFEQLKGVPVDQWDQDLFDRLEATKVHLLMKLNEMGEFIRGLNRELKKFVNACLSSRGTSPLKKIRMQFLTVLDTRLEKQLKQAETYLNEKFLQFSQEFLFLKKVEAQIETEYHKFQNYAILECLDKEKQRHFKRLWRLLKLWGASRTENEIFREPIQTTLRYACPSGKTTAVLRDYLGHLKEKVFDLARQYRAVKDIAAQAVVCTWRAEVHTLGKTILTFRDFLLATDKRARVPFGFKIKSLAPESRKAKELLLLKEETDQVDKWLIELFHAQELGQEEDPYIDLMKFRKVDKLLHDMGQPLISRSLMKNKARELISVLSKAQELVSSLPEVSDLMLDTLLRAFKVDWKHETLISTPGFSSVWEIHHGLSHTYKSAAHLKRMKIYKKVTQHLRYWLLEHELTRHTLDAEHQIHDIQATLQEFYHTLDAEALTLSHLHEFRKELLEERVFFANFFQFLRQHPHEGNQIRHEFSFVDKYFNAIDDKLATLKEALKDSPSR